MTIRDLDKLGGVDFERALQPLLEANGFVGIAFTPKSSDFGADVIAAKEGVKWAIQIKRTTSPVPISAIQEILGGSRMPRPTLRQRTCGLS